MSLMQTAGQQSLNPPRLDSVRNSEAPRFIPTPGELYAHTTEDERQWEPLFTPFGDDREGECQRESCAKCESLAPDHGHLNKVAYWTARFATEMFPGNSEASRSAWEWGYLAGMWHDLGKFAPKWQVYLRTKAESHSDEVAGKVDHSTAGAQHADHRVRLFGRLLAYAIAGHHAGLANGLDETGSNLGKRLAKEVADYSSAPASMLDFSDCLPAPRSLDSSHSLSCYIRMLFSCLVDADFLATEAFMSPTRTQFRSSVQPTIAELERALAKHLASFGPPQTAVNHRRAEVLNACRTKAANKPGLFSLTVPTGGGKTLSSLAFALKHARIHGLRRIIYVIPYTSIIEQNARVFREALDSLGPDVVLEHHSNLDPDSEYATTTSRLSAENWDARLIVTTNVQFFESLHANKTSKCRKLHRIAHSVVILDEAQSLPTELLQPCLRAIEDLTTHYHSSVVLCTATQPAIHRSEEFQIGLRAPTEIIPDPVALYESLRRVAATNLGPCSDEQLVYQLRTHPQCLCIVNTRREARKVFDLLPQDGTSFHLSALMCPEHRSEKLEEIKMRLGAGEAVRLVSTQLIEAGVDIDFPVVFRALAGLDSIAQAAGRCDREGKLTARAGMPGGKLFIFETESLPPPGFLRSTAASAAEVLSSEPPDLLGLDAVESYFRTHYWKHEEATDSHHILECWPSNPPSKMRSEDELLLFQFRKCAESFRLIDDYSEPVIIPFGATGKDLCTELRETFDPVRRRYLARKLQRYTVAIPMPQHARLISTKIARTFHEQFHVLNSDAHYSNNFGLHPEPDLILSHDQSIL